MTIRVEEYVREDGSSPYKKWFDSLDPQSAAKVTTAKLRLELGNTSSVKWFAGMGECVIDWGPGYRIYLARDGESLIVLFGGGTKRGQQRDIDQAKALLAEYKARKKALSKVGKSTGGTRKR
jgi:putative addiction module killer protein